MVGSRVTFWGFMGFSRKSGRLGSVDDYGVTSSEAAQSHIHLGLGTWGFFYFFIFLFFLFVF